MNRNCKTDPDRSCYICGHVVFLDSQPKITDLVKKTYEQYFEVRLRHQDNPFAPHIGCKTCLKILLDWRNKKGKRWHWINQWFGGKCRLLMLLLHDKSQRF